MRPLFADCPPLESPRPGRTHVAVFLVYVERIFMRIVAHCRHLTLLVVLVIAGAVHATSVNVRDYGAMGDGVTDDTEAIQRAAQAAKVKFDHPSPVGSRMQSGPVLLFPYGHYVINETIDISNVLEVRGEGQAILEQKNPDADLLYATGVWRMMITGLTFSGGRDQVDLKNGNLDSGRIVIDYCRFYGANGFAVRTDVLSTTVELTRNTFIRCHQVWYLARSDLAMMRDAWIMTSNEAAHKAVIEHRGHTLTLENICGVPLPEVPGQRWIDNYGTNLTVRNVRFGGEGGGFTPIYNYTKYSPSVSGTTIQVFDSTVAANASGNANCVIYCFEVPNAIQIEHVRSAGAVPIALDDTLDLTQYFQAGSESLFAFDVRAFIGEKDASLPAGLGHPQIHPLPIPSDWLNDADALRAMEQAVTEWQRPLDEPEISDWIRGPEPYVPQSDPSNYVEVSGWRAAGKMDATSEENADRLMVREVDGDVFILHRRDQPGGWPHIEAEITVDLDRYPYMTWRQLEGTAPGPFVIKVIDQQTGASTAPLRLDHTFQNEFVLWACDVRRLLGEGSERHLTVRFYPIGHDEGTTEARAKAGDFTVLDFVRFEAK